MENEIKLKYTVIVHDVRDRFSIHNNEYVLLDTIYHLSNNPDNRKNGWCYASKKTLAGIVGCTETAIFGMINTLIQMGLLERDPDTSYLRVSSLWYKAALANTKESLEDLKKLSRIKKVNTDTKESLVSDTKESLYNIYNNNINNNIDNISEHGSENKTEKSQITDTSSEEIKKKKLDAALSGKKEEEQKMLGRRKLMDEELKVLEVFKSNIYKLCSEKTNSIQEGIPRAIKEFKQYYPTDYLKKLLDAIVSLRYSKWYKDMLAKSPAAISPKIIFSLSFIQNTLLPLSHNQKQNGQLYSGSTSPSELREIEEANKRRVEAFMADNN